MNWSSFQFGLSLPSTQLACNQIHHHGITITTPSQVPHQPTCFRKSDGDPVYTTPYIIPPITVNQGGTSCTILQAGLWGVFLFLGFLRILVVSKGESEASHRRWKGCPRSSILNLHCSILNPQSSEMPKNNVLIYGILVTNVARISTYALWG